MCMFVKSDFKKSYSGVQNPLLLKPPIGQVTYTIQTMMEEYLKWKNSYAPTAAVRYRNRLSTFAEYIHPQTIISEIATNDIIEYHSNMRNEGYSPKTIEYSSIILKNFFLFCQGRGVCTLNPSEIRLVRSISPDKDLITAKEFGQMSESLNEQFFEELTRKLVIHLLWDCGMRVSELCDINISDIEETSKPGIRCAKIRRRKARRYNIVVWGNETNRLLNHYLGVRLCLDYPTDALLICRNGQGKRITPRSIQRWVKEIAQTAGIDKNMTPHCFRHSKAHRVLDKSENIRDVQCVLGHSSPISSFHYLGLNKERQLAVSEKYL